MNLGALLHLPKAEHDTVLRASLSGELQNLQGWQGSETHPGSFVQNQHLITWDWDPTPGGDYIETSTALTTEQEEVIRAAMD